eukprot:CAMPEP_0196149096 /NCGR_PEP_ID=MMETSP0910-20130528/29111_1 /TAXON_ID=49265 /ORGANISM="Thalassiosira rotula, Strain GSO102" /LENGTH=75 /DNA_ID=CAMNT_0041411953 /DNA_START=371 /DNA_END=595 /DNA_ORIENTATION=+
MKRRNVDDDFAMMTGESSMINSSCHVYFHAFLHLPRIGVGMGVTSRGGTIVVHKAPKAGRVAEAASRTGGESAAQ